MVQIMLSKQIFYREVNTIFKTIPIKRYVNGQTISQNDTIVTEMGIKIQIGSDQTIRLTALPDAIDVLAIGYLFSKGYIDSMSAIRSIHSNLESGVVSVDLFNSPEIKTSATTKPFKELDSRSESHLQREKNFKNIPTESNPIHHISSLLNAANQLSCASELFRATGGVHSSGLWMDNRFLWAYDDVGRHNSVDKVIGRALQDFWPIPETAALV